MSDRSPRLYYGRAAPMAQARTIGDVGGRVPSPSRSDTQSAEARIGRATKVHGRIGGEGDLVIEGQVEGDISLSGAVTIAEGAEVTSEIEAQTVTIAGTLDGNVSAQGPVRIAAGSRVRGDMRGSTVGIDEGAQFAGRLECEFELPAELCAAAGTGGGRAARTQRSLISPRRETRMASTVIGAGITIEGEITSDEDVVVQGTVRGKLTAKEAVTVEHGATRRGGRRGASLDGRRRLTGNVTAQRARRPPGGRARHRQREGRAHHDRRRCPVQGQRRHGRVRRRQRDGGRHGDRARRPASAGASPAQVDLEIQGHVDGEVVRRRRRHDRRRRAWSAASVQRHGASSCAARCGRPDGRRGGPAGGRGARRRRRSRAARRDRRRARSCVGYVQTG